MLLLHKDISIQIQDLIANTALKIITKGNSIVTSWYAGNACHILTGSCGLTILLLLLADVKKIQADLLKHTLGFKRMRFAKKQKNNNPNQPNPKQQQTNTLYFIYIMLC